MTANLHLTRATGEISFMIYLIPDLSIQPPLSLNFGISFKDPQESSDFSISAKASLNIAMLMISMHSGASFFPLPLIYT